MDQKDKRNKQIEITIKNMSKVIKRKEVLSNINVSFSNGQVYGIKGYNGSGKTMLMRVIAGLIFPTEGEVCIYSSEKNGEPVRIGMLIENPAFLDEYTGYGNLQLLASIENRISKADIERTLDDVGLSSYPKLKYKKYSLGMKQRLGIAAAVMEHPEIILLDEPINGLDQEGVEMAAKIIKEERERGAVVILSCHDERFLNMAADKIYEIENGKLHCSEE